MKEVKRNVHPAGIVCINEDENSQPPRIRIGAVGDDSYSGIHEGSTRKFTSGFEDRSDRGV